MDREKAEERRRRLLEKRKGVTIQNHDAECDKKPVREYEAPKLEDLQPIENPPIKVRKVEEDKIARDPPKPPLGYMKRKSLFKEERYIRMIPLLVAILVGFFPFPFGFLVIILTDFVADFYCLYGISKIWDLFSKTYFLRCLFWYGKRVPVFAMYAFIIIAIQSFVQYRHD